MAKGKILEGARKDRVILTESPDADGQWSRNSLLDRANLLRFVPDGDRVAEGY